jgi:putative PIN family toxin of toxin-antitoxin system
VVRDTTVVLSGIFFGGVPCRILSAGSDGRFQLVLSPEILDEYRRAGDALARRSAERGAALAPILGLIATHAALIDVPPLLQPVSQDPDDDKFLAAALAAGASIVVSGDGHLRAVSEWHGIRVLSPRQFMEAYPRED